MSLTLSTKRYLLSRLFKKCVSEQYIFNQTKRQRTTATKLLYSEYGDPVKVIQKQEEVIEDELKSTEILIKMLASPVNPADINTIQGKYPVRPTLPSVPGNEGVGEIVSVGKNVQNFTVGDRVVPFINALGTWRTHLILPEQNVFKVPKKLGLIEAATLTVNPCTAYRMLRDFISLKPGDTVIQNGGNSACAQNVIQICRVWGIRSVNIVRDRPNIQELKDFLIRLGASHVLTEEELRKTDIFKSGSVPKPRLALNCVGGKNALELLRHLQVGSPMVTYGGMSRQPVTVPTGALIFNDVHVRGFWMTGWTNNHAQSVDRVEMIDELISMMTNGEMHGPAYTMIPFDSYKDALIKSTTAQGMTGKKFILDFQ